MTVGAQLRQARSERKLSLADVTAATKIQPWVLEALEADKFQDQMSPVYVKGFLTSYAKFLHLPSEPLLAQLPWPAPDPVLEDVPPPSPSVPVLARLPLPLLRRLGVGVAIAGAVAGLIAINPLRWVSNISWPSLTLPSIAKAAPEKAAEKRHGKTTKRAKQVKPSTQKVASLKGGGQPAAKPVAPPPTSEPVAPVAPILASVTPVKEPVALPTPPLTSIATLQPLELSVIAHRTTWIRVRADGKLLTQQRLPRGAKERWTANKQFELIISKPTEVDLTLNGQPISPFAVAHKGRVLITHRGVTQLPPEEE